MDHLGREEGYQFINKRMDNPKVKVVVFFKGSLNKVIYELSCWEHAKEYASDIITMGCIVNEEEDGVKHQTYYPVHRINKVKIVDLCQKNSPENNK